jgi:hypothetical protein
MGMSGEPLVSNEIAEIRGFFTATKQPPPYWQRLGVCVGKTEWKKGALK